MKNWEMSTINNPRNFKADWLDVALTKIAVFAATLFLAKLWSPILDLEWYWYFIVWIIAAIKPMITFYRWLKSAGTK